MSKHHNRPADTTVVDPLAAAQPMRAAHGSLILPGDVDPDLARAVIAAADDLDAGPAASLPPGATDVEGGLRLTIQRRDEEIAELRADLQRVDIYRPRVDHTALALQTTALVDLHREHCGKPGYKGRYLDAATKVGNALCAEIERG